MVLYGVKECPSDSSRYARLESDLASVVSVLTTLESSFHSQSIKDCYRLGKFNPESNKPRPILIQFVRAVDVTNILAKKGRLAQPFYIKPDMTPTSVTVFDCNLTQYILEPTHIKGNTLDLVFTNNDISISNLAITPPGKAIDTHHFLITFSPDHGIQSPIKVPSRFVFDLSKADLDGLCSYLLDTNFEKCLFFNPMTLNLFGTS